MRRACIVLINVFLCVSLLFSNQQKVITLTGPKKKGAVQIISVFSAVSSGLTRSNVYVHPFCFIIHSALEFDFLESVVRMENNQKLTGLLNQCVSLKKHEGSLLFSSWKTRWMTLTDDSLYIRKTELPGTLLAAPVHIGLLADCPWVLYAV